MYSRGNWTIFAFLMAAALLTIYMWYKLGSHAAYRTGERDDEGNMEVLDATPSNANDRMNKAFGISKLNDVNN